MQTRLKCEKPDEIEFTLTVTMKAKDWESLREQLTQKWPSSDLGHQINNLLAQARKVYWPTETSAS